ncbi:hypothetical protein AYO39_01940 [Actinobacteria bacterium SCGC AG-212-D09]|nr:hypothetical protein AYO39_01940 [Actinobacteria bacterium SCGC AG-212-D09]
MDDLETTPAASAAISYRLTFGERALVELKRARKELGPEFTRPDRRASLYVKQAKVYAVLDIADALNKRPEF